MARIKSRQKLSGAYFTPPAVAASLVRWAAHSENDRLLDPSCGDGQFISRHRNSVGIEQDGETAKQAIENAPWALVHEGDFFRWASETTERFNCVAGNPPFIRYQNFSGQIRADAFELCRQNGVRFSGLASSWAPFLVAASTVLHRGARMAFVVPAEIGHAPYAKPLLEHLVTSFAKVQIIAVRRKLFPDLSEDCWLLYTDGYGGQTDHIAFTIVDKFVPSETPPSVTRRISVSEIGVQWKWRIRPYLMADEARDAYLQLKDEPGTRLLGDIASVGIGYVTGANDFFHLRKSEAERAGIPAEFLQPTIRNGRALPEGAVTKSSVQEWLLKDEPILLLRLPKTNDLPSSVWRYLQSDEGREASTAFKCRSRDPWFSVPDVNLPDFFLTYMSGTTPNLVRNDAQCSCTNSVHAVRLKSKEGLSYLKQWGEEAVQLSAELEGHPLGGGMLKVEPREASQILLPGRKIKTSTVFREALAEMRAWRHHG